MNLLPLKLDLKMQVIQLSAQKIKRISSLSIPAQLLPMPEPSLVRLSGTVSVIIPMHELLLPAVLQKLEQRNSLRMRNFSDGNTPLSVTVKKIVWC